MTKKIIIDKNKCIGCGTCVALASETFEIDKDGKSKIKNLSGNNEETIKLTVDSCPTQAIKIQG